MSKGKQKPPHSGPYPRFLVGLPRCLLGALLVWPTVGAPDPMASASTTMVGRELA